MICWLGAVFLQRRGAIESEGESIVSNGLDDEAAK